LGILDGDEAVALAATTTRHSRLLSIAVQPGQRMPARTTSLGRILLAHLPGADDPESEAIREAGHVITDGLYESGLRALGVPVRDHHGTVVASLSIGVIASQVSVEELRERCLPASLRAAEELSEYV
ncbi:MAG: IclR family transcriptional regulator C-terminal domain-containing protein, partial [Acidimicrobiia bacterium]